ncbi:hypothetical protein WMY93_024407 [Mugilogobius chulae]|uniref:G-protein coupled receptors family 1 profile domain-containing protein n=1 Tax=Mugilogobius chulae TaxID=88201 RepID=A0AAW0N9K1_9GOBI
MERARERVRERKREEKERVKRKKEGEERKRERIDREKEKKKRRGEELQILESAVVNISRFIKSLCLRRPPALLTEVKGRLLTPGQSSIKGRFKKNQCLLASKIRRCFNPGVEPYGKPELSTMEFATELPSLLSNQSDSCPPADTTIENTLFGFFYILPVDLLAPTRHHSSPANVFLVHLAIADLSYVIVLPLRATYHLTGGHWPFGEVPCRAAGFLFYVNMYASLYFLACVAGDRYLAVVHATAEVDGVTVCLQLYREKATRNALISLAVAFTPPFLATLSCYLLIIKSLHGGSRLEPTLKLRALRTIGLVLLIYVVCFLPYHVSRATFILGYNHPGVSCGTRRGLSLANRLTSLLTCMNGAMDPLVYLFGAEKFRGTLTRLLCKDKGSLSGATSGELKATHESSVSAKSEF